MKILGVERDLRYTDAERNELYVKEIAANASDELTLVLAAIFKDDCQHRLQGISCDKIVSTTNLNKSTVATILRILQFLNFIYLRKLSHVRLYTISDYGIMGLHYMLDKEKVSGADAQNYVYFTHGRK